MRTGMLLAPLSVALWLATSATAEEVGTAPWPRKVEGSGAVVVVYQPQPERLDGDTLSSRMVVSLQAEGEEDAAYGTVWLHTHVAADRDKRTVVLSEGTVQRVEFPGATSQQESNVSRIVDDRLTGWTTVMHLDALTATLEEARVERHQASGLNTESPTILYRDKPALLVSIDGEPIARQATNASLSYVANTPRRAVIDPRTQKYYLFDGKLWLEAADPFGKWSVPQYPPTEVIDVTPDDDARKALELGEKGYGYQVPEIIVATEPTELIVTTGKPEAAAIDGTSLAAVSNTGSDLFFDPTAEKYFVLLAGRWFASSLLDGPWVNVAATDLPESFAQIPADSDYGRIRAHVAGTAEAREAVMEAQVPQTAKVPLDRAYAVSYEGPPRFEPIEGTGMHYAVNTRASVVQTDDGYYSADAGVWYSSAEAQGPWRVATEIDDDIYTIPPTNPMYHATFLHLFDRDEEHAEFGYYPGYSGTYVDGETVVYGTGWTYRPWTGREYIARPVTWGYGFRYVPRVGWGWTFSYDPGYYGRSIGFEIWDPCCFWGPAHWNNARGPYDPRGPFDPRGRFDTRGPYDPRGRRDPRGVGDPRGPGDSRGMGAGRGPEHMLGPGGVGANNLFAGPDGDVYRHSSGAWERRTGGGWAGAEAPHMQGQLNARATGMARAGGMRGGGRRR